MDLYTLLWFASCVTLRVHAAPWGYAESLELILDAFRDHPQYALSMLWQPASAFAADHELLGLVFGRRWLLRVTWNMTQEELQRYVRDPHFPSQLLRDFAAELAPLDGHLSPQLQQVLRAALEQRRGGFGGSGSSSGSGSGSASCMGGGSGSAGSAGSAGAAAGTGAALGLAGGGTGTASSERTLSSPGVSTLPLAPLLFSLAASRFQFDGSRSTVTCGTLLAMTPTGQFNAIGALSLLESAIRAIMHL